VDQTQFQQTKVEQNHFNNNLQQSQAIKADNQIPPTKNNHSSSPPSQQNQFNQQQQFNNNMHLRSKGNDVAYQKSAPRNNEYLEQQQQQRPSPAQGTTAPDTNHLNSTKSEDGLKQNSITKTPSEAATSQSVPQQNKPPTLMETFDLSDISSINLEGFNLKQVVIPVWQA
jgi:hypothetical protein